MNDKTKLPLAGILKDEDGELVSEPLPKDKRCTDILLVVDGKTVDPYVYKPDSRLIGAGPEEVTEPGE